MKEKRQQVSIEEIAISNMISIEALVNKLIAKDKNKRGAEL